MIRSLESLMNKIKLYKAREEVVVEKSKLKSRYRNRSRSNLIKKSKL